MTDDNVVTLPTSTFTQVGDDPEMDTLLRSYQALQMRNSHVRSLVAQNLGIGVTDLRALLFISGSEDVTPKQVGAFLELTSGAVTNLIDRMTDAGFLRRVPHPKDRRSVVLELAPEGAESVDRIGDFYRRSFADAVPREQFAAATAILNAIGESLARTVEEDIARAAADETA